MSRSLAAHARPLAHALAVVAAAVGPALAHAQAYTFTTINVPGALFTTVAGINAAGQIVGGYSDDVSSLHAFVYDAGTFSVFDLPGAPRTDASGINAAGQIVGTSFDRPTGFADGFLYDAGTFTTVRPAGADGSFAFGINDAGDIVGDYGSGAERGFIRDHTTGAFTTIDPPDATYGTRATGINAAGEVVGNYADSRGIVRSFLYDAGTLRVFDFPGARVTNAWGINDLGQVVGFDDVTLDGFIRDRAGTFTTIGVPGATLTEPYGINDAGQIVGYYQDVSGTHGFLATPNPAITTPEPGVTALLGAGLAGLGAVVRRRRRTATA